MIEPESVAAGAAIDPQRADRDLLQVLVASRADAPAAHCIARQQIERAHIRAGQLREQIELTVIEPEASTRDAVVELDRVPLHGDHGDPADRADQMVISNE